ncbi:MAG: hypothetical protein ACRDRV_09760 [Pseudonocardiaceae bacterium]
MTRAVSLRAVLRRMSLRAVLRWMSPAPAGAPGRPVTVTGGPVRKRLRTVGGVV